MVQDLRYVGDAETIGTVHLPDSQGEPNCGFISVVTLLHNSSINICNKVVLISML
jgi:hypothetical protein